MKFHWLKSAVILMVFFFSFQTLAKPITMGGEIPWPLAHQYRITAENSRGLWKLTSQQGAKYYNVEILDQVNDITFVRVSEIDMKTFKVISWGEGFFKDSQQSQNSLWSLYFDISVPNTVDVGRYFYMYPNGDITENPYMVRLVEVRNQFMTSLGISIYRNSATGGKQHVLGDRMQADPLDCRLDDVQDPEVIDSLTCELPGNEYKDQDSARK